MTKVTKEEVLKIARIASLAIHEDELDGMVKQLQDVLSYAARVQEIAQEVDLPSSKNVNVFREDIIVKSDPEMILAQAPEREENFFVVPAILESNE